MGHMKKRKPTGHRRAQKRIMLKENKTAAEAKEIFWERHAEERDSCKKAHYTVIKEKCVEKMGEVIKFFLGDKMTVKKYRRMHRMAMKDRKEYKQHRLLRPWPLEAYLAHCEHRRILKDTAIRNVARKQLIVYFDCRLCGPGKICKASVQYGVAMQMAVGAISKPDWLRYCDNPGHRTQFDYSHLHGLN